MGSGEAVGCGAKCSKFMLIVFNFIFWLSGAAVLGVGIWLLVDPSLVKMQEVLDISSGDPYLKYIAYFLIAIGAFVFIVGFLGCCGAIKESRCMLGMYIFFMVLIMGAEIAAGVLAIVYKTEIEGKFKEEVTGFLKDDYMQNNTAGIAVSYIQVRLDCCGMTGVSDYSMSKYTNSTGNTFPPTCCPVEGEKHLDDLTKNTFLPACLAQIENANPTEVNKIGCYDSTLAWFTSQATILIGVGIGIACLELFGFIFAICLCRNVGEEE